MPELPSLSRMPSFLRDPEFHRYARGLPPHQQQELIQFLTDAYIYREMGIGKKIPLAQESESPIPIFEDLRFTTRELFTWQKAEPDDTSA